MNIEPNIEPNVEPNVEPNIEPNFVTPLNLLAAAVCVTVRNLIQINLDCSGQKCLL